AIQEDVQAIAVTSYQGGHMEFFRYMYDLLQQRGAGHIRLFGGGGGTILPEEIAALQEYGITRIFSPDDGREMGLQGMINELLRQCDFEVSSFPQPADAAQAIDQARLARLIPASKTSRKGSMNCCRPTQERSAPRTPAGLFRSLALPAPVGRVNPHLPTNWSVVI